MKPDDSILRLQIRLNVLEDPDVVAYLSQYAAGTERAARVRLLMRLGFAAFHGRQSVVHVTEPSPAPAVAPTERRSATQSNDLSAFERLGLSPEAFSEFKYGGN